MGTECLQKQEPAILLSHTGRHNEVNSKFRFASSANHQKDQEGNIFWLFSKSTNQQGRSSASHQKRINKAKVSSSENDQKQINDVKVLVGSSANNEKERNSPIQLVFIEDEKEFSAFHMFSFQYTFSAQLKD